MRVTSNVVRLGRVSKLVAQFSGAVRGLSTEGTVQWQCNPGENSVTLGGVSVSVGFAFPVRYKYWTSDISIGLTTANDTAFNSMTVSLKLDYNGYYRQFIPQYASLAAPLTDLTRKSTQQNSMVVRVCNCFPEAQRRL